MAHEEWKETYSKRLTSLHLKLRKHSLKKALASPAIEFSASPSVNELYCGVGRLFPKLRI